ncbi:MAG: serine hydroxymethyltransferase [Candidatus Spechtbacterales bacterium]|nr:serine hydroxymethyltransferase [Candidatus Spechtbacterales bacterium]
MDKELNKTDPAVADINKSEEERQLETINLIASENYVSPAVREASSSVFTNKYSEGYPRKRYYPGNEYVDEVEELAQKRALEVFGIENSSWAVNVQPYSGSPANFAVYTALLSEQDIALGMKLASGGHLTHGHKVSDSGRYFNFIQYGITDDGIIDYGEVEKLAKEHKPKLIVVGTSAYSLKIDYEKFSNIAKNIGAFLMADMAHIAGLVAGGQHPSPFEHCDIVTTTTHKTLRGPRGAMIFSRGDELAVKVNKAVFPGLQGGPHNQQTAAIAVAMKEALAPEFKKYAEQIVKNAKVLARELKNKGYDIISGGTENHLFLVDVTNKGMSGGEAEKLLEQAGIIANRNTIPNDPRKPFDPSGIRIGTPAVTTRGMADVEMKKIADFIDRALKGEDIEGEVKKLALKFPTPGFE